MNTGQSHPAPLADRNQDRRPTGPGPRTESPPPLQQPLPIILLPSASSRYRIAPLETPASSDLQPFAFDLQPFHVSSVNIGSCARCYRIAPLEAPASSDLHPFTVGVQPFEVSPPNPEVSPPNPELPSPNPGLSSPKAELSCAAMPPAAARNSLNRKKIRKSQPRPPKNPLFISNPLRIRGTMRLAGWSRRYWPPPHTASTAFPALPLPILGGPSWPIRIQERSGEINSSKPPQRT